MNNGTKFIIVLIALIASVIFINHRILMLKSRIIVLEEKMSLIEDSTLSFDVDESGDLSLVWSVTEDGIEYPYARLPAVPPDGEE